jgi:hypothetical protein
MLSTVSYFILGQQLQRRRDGLLGREEPALLHHAVRADDDVAALHAASVLEHADGAAELRALVAGEIVREGLLVLPHALQRRVVLAAAEDGVACARESVVVVTEAAGLLGSSARIGLRVEENDQATGAGGPQVAQRHGRAVLDRHRHVGAGRAHRDRVRHSACVCVEES